MKRRVVLPRGDESTRRIRSVLKSRAVHAITPDENAPSLPACDEARRFWSERAWSEFAAIPAMGQTTLAGVRGGMSLDALGVLTQIASDEVAHTEISRDLANELGGYVEDIPSGLHYQPAVLAQPSEMSLGAWIVANGCISETLSLELMRIRLPYARHPRVRATLQRIHQDEAVHARAGWMLAEQVLPTLSEGTREELAEYALALIETLRKTWVTSGLPTEVRREARRIREVTSEQGLGAAPPDEADAALETKLASFVVPRLRALGLVHLPVTP